MEAASNNIHLHLTAGEAGRHPEVLSCQCEVTYRKEQVQMPPIQVEKVKNELAERGIPRDLLDEKQHLFAIELRCNPGITIAYVGCEKELVQELQKLLTNEVEGENDTIFQKIIAAFLETDMECKVFQSQNKVYLVAHEQEPRVYSEESKVKAFYDNFRPGSNATLSISAEGFKETRTVEQEQQQFLSLSYFDFNLDYPNLKEIGTKLLKYLTAIKEEFPLIAVLSQMKRASIRTKMSSLEEIARTMNFELSHEPLLEMFEQGKTLIQNEFRVCYINLSGFLVDTTVKVDDPRFMLSKYLFRAMDYISRMF